MGVKLPHMPVWVYDLEADEDCSLMTLAEYGAYMRLLQRQWIEGSIPVDPARLARLLRVTADEMESIWPVLADKFVQDGRGRQKNRRLDEERQAALHKVEVNRANGKRGGRPPQSERKSEKKPNGSIRASGSGSVSGSTSSNRKKEPEKFDAFYAAYPRKTARERAKSAWVKQGCDDVADVVMAGLERCKASRDWKGRDSKHLPYPATWLNDHGWNDEPDSGDKADETRRRKEAFESLGEDVHRELFEAVKAQKPGTYHSRGSMETERAMRRIAKQKGLIPA